MRLSEFVGKEVINIFDGGRLGVINESDLVIDKVSGEVESIVLPNRSLFLGIKQKGFPLVIPWGAVRKVGSQTIIIEMEFGGRKQA